MWLFVRCGIFSEGIVYSANEYINNFSSICVTAEIWPRYSADRCPTLDTRISHINVSDTADNSWKSGCKYSLVIGTLRSQYIHPLEEATSFDHGQHENVQNLLPVSLSNPPLVSARHMTVVPQDQKLMSQGIRVKDDRHNKSPLISNTAQNRLPKFIPASNKARSAVSTC